MSEMRDPRKDPIPGDSLPAKRSKGMKREKMPAAEVLNA